MKKFITLILILFWATACGNIQPTAAQSEISPMEILSPAATPTRIVTPTAKALSITVQQIPVQPDIVNRARTDLAQRLGISVDEIEVASTTVDEFPGNNFGCLDRFKQNGTLFGKQSQPESGVSPALVTATEVVLDVPSHATRYIYRGKGTQVVFCFEKGY